ncbi:MAG: hypothetical protein M3P96_05450 [Actinomycetota bacterium]|nr:hypothetical protein [Actinomycetota bacterium]
MTPPPVLPPGSDPAEHPDVPDEQGRVWCDRCRRRVPPEERRRHRGGRGWERLVELSEEELSDMGSRRSQQPEGWQWGF